MLRLMWRILTTTIQRKIQCVNAVLNIAFVVALVLATYVRFSHTGKVCSGDFITDGDHDNQAYLTDSGLFLKIYLFSIYSLIAATLFSPCFIFALAYCLVDY